MVFSLGIHGNTSDWSGSRQMNGNRVLVRRVKGVVIVTVATRSVTHKRGAGITVVMFQRRPWVIAVTSGQSDIAICLIALESTLGSWLQTTGYRRHLLNTSTGL